MFGFDRNFDVGSILWGIGGVVLLGFRLGGWYSKGVWVVFVGSLEVGFRVDGLGRSLCVTC